MHRKSIGIESFLINQWKTIRGSLNSLRFQVALIYFLVTVIPVTVISISVYFLWADMEKNNGLS